MLKLVSTLGADRVFDPETIQILVGAFDEAWKTVQASATHFVSERHVEIARQIIAKSIIDDAARGKHDQHELAHTALVKFRRDLRFQKP